ncbi:MULTISPECIES: LysR family transcriptional regulator [Pseudonocardia]|uniref:HTH-type transcriptional regulator GltC n=2 Tax=Pseudonocardia TaxID=1847 RepID=A0A1Y2N6E9_PSEAH|nr:MULTISPECIES: LysR family transcriptional regulator [Pseudonocardia]OSY42739.1 HTH-type transcriptional regulator GltC [Pseudonocardia autotrophica]TDN77316.1 DNA-binding transcriptional LysR family regulator [Pseudonocardia autotrophica]BBG01338.1 transcriptional regulator [Pseudonocardia autotrophica]GEC24394.1 transcriptional regulator [Pseudonocardia saturnea]
MWDLHRLRLLHELRLRETVTEVARTLNYAPSSVSQQLAKLEEEVGVRLLEPDGRRLRLTPHGELVARHAAEILDLQEGVRSRLAAAGPVGETVRLATLETTGRALLPHALTRLRESTPHLRLEASVVPPETGLAELETRGFDLAVAEQYPGHSRSHRPSLDRDLLGTDPVRLAVAENSGVTGLADTTELAWVMEPEGTAARQWAVQQCRAAGFEPDIRFDSADLEIHIHLVRAGHAVSILPDLVWTGNREGVRLIELSGPSHRELFTSARLVSAAHPAIGQVRAALADAFAVVGGGAPVSR